MPAERVVHSIAQRLTRAFGLGSKLFLSTDKLKTIKPITVKNADGTDFVTM